MKITDVRTYHLVYPMEAPFANSQVWNRTRSAGVVEIATDSGLVGWGEGLTVDEGEALRPRLVGRDPQDTEVIWQDLFGNGWGDVAAISAVDIALWDLLGKAQGLPVYRLLGGAFRQRVPAYASGLFHQDRPDLVQALSQEARRYADAGFPAVKMKIGFGADTDVRNVGAVRQAIGEGVGLAVDANCGYEVGSAIDVGGRIAQFDLLWFEEPLPTDDVAGYREVRQALRMRIAGGEMLRARWAFRDLIQQRGLDIVQPDISVAGGFTECRKIAAMASANRVRVLPHMWGTAIRLAATLHWQATLPDEPGAINPFPSLFEYDMTENRLRTELAREPILAADGSVPVPQGPGLGVEVDRRLLERFAV